MRNLATRGLRILVSAALILAVVFCLEKAWAGVWTYLGEVEYLKNDWGKASEFFTRAGAFERDNPEFLFWEGRNAFMLGRQRNEPALIRLAEHDFSVLTERMPFSGKSWLYLALSRLEASRLDQKATSRLTWNAIKPLFLRAIQNEPGNTWISYVAATQFLAHDRFLSPAEKKTVMSLLKKSAKPVLYSPDELYLPNASPLLNSILSFIWNRYGQFDLLRSVVPEDYASYRAFLRWLEQNHLWKFCEEIHPAYLKFENEIYRHACEKGEDFLKKEKYEKAFAMFRKAFWAKNWNYLRAKGGIIASEYGMKQWTETDNELFHQNYRDVLRAILEEEDEPLGESVNFLRSVIIHSEDPYLMGLFAYRTGNFEKARKWFEKIPPDQKMQPRFLAATYWQLGEKNRAIDMLKDTLQEKVPDVRSLLLLEQWGLKGQDAMLLQRKLGESVSIRQGTEYWWIPEQTAPLMDRHGTAIMGLNLRPGRVRISVHLRCAVPGPDGEGAYVLFYMNGRDVGGRYVGSSDWSVASVEVSTTGGKRWLGLEFLNGRKKSDTLPGPELEVGDVTVVDLDR